MVSLKQACWFEIQAIRSAFALMSRIPMGHFMATDAQWARAAIWYPLVGVVLGGVVVGIAAILPTAWPPALQAAFLLVIWVGFSGGLHLDGLADSADAWVGGLGDKARTLAIMKDPTSGPMAVVVLLLVLLLKWALLFTLLVAEANFLLLLPPLLARAWLLPMLDFMPYARLQSAGNTEISGMVNPITEHFPRWWARWSFIKTHVLVLLLLWIFTSEPVIIGVSLMAVAGLMYARLRSACMARIGGYTGDTLGAAVELHEVAILLVLTFFI